MDINNLIASSIIPTKDEMYLIDFPSFSGMNEIAMYYHNGTRQFCGTDEFFPHLRLGNIEHDIHKIILASRFFGHIGVRIIDANDIYQEDIFLIEEGEIFSFALLGRAYLAFIYTDIGGEKKIFTNFESGNLFQWSIEDDIFIIVNTLSGSIVFEKKITIMYKCRDIATNDTVNSYTLHIMEDPLFPNVYGFMEKLLSIKSIRKLIKISTIGDILSVTFISASEKDLMRFIGFLGKYVCIITDDLISFPGYLTKKDAEDNQFQLSENFISETSIDFIDPRWHSLRLGLIELGYFSNLLRMHIEHLQNGIQDIINLNNKHIEFQKIHMNMTLEDIISMHTRYLKQYQMLITLLQNKIS